LLFKAIGILPEAYDTSYFRTVFFAPLGMQHNWFASVYLLLYCLFPFLAVLVKKLSKRQLQACILILLVIFSKISQILYPNSGGFDDNGYGIIWMVCLFMVAGYIKLYVPITGKWGKKLLCYVIFTLLTFISYFAITMVYLKFGKLDEFKTIFYSYNSPTVIVSSIALFLAFLNMGQKKVQAKTGIKIEAKTKSIGKRFIEKGILYTASLTFGIYLIHDHILLRDLWVTLWDVPEAFTKWYFVFHFLDVVITVFIICGIIEACRKWLFGFVYRSKFWSWIQEKLLKVNALMNGES
jgi:peptidoglycan/LPS O-acetylase OafA/YrhL